jgi:hypothetical protein
VGCDQSVGIKNHQIKIKINKIKQGFEPEIKIEIDKWFVDCQARFGGWVDEWIDGCVGG